MGGGGVDALEKQKATGFRVLILIRDESSILVFSLRAPLVSNMTLFLLFLLLRFSEASDQGAQVITAHLKQNVTLPCRAPNSSPIRAAEWSRPDLGSKYVFFYRDEQADKTHQHPSFENRVELADSRLKDGDLSLILKNVRYGDAGKYECRVKQATRRKRAFIKADPVSIIDLHVTETRVTTDSGRMAENTRNGQHAAGPAGLFLCLLVLPLMYAVNH